MRQRLNKEQLELFQGGKGGDDDFYAGKQTA
jgi:hypothetical protein